MVSCLSAQLYSAVCVCTALPPTGEDEELLGLGARSQQIHKSQFSPSYAHNSMFIRPFIICSPSSGSVYSMRLYCSSDAYLESQIKCASVRRTSETATAARRNRSWGRKMSFGANGDASKTLG